MLIWYFLYPLVFAAVSGPIKTQAIYTRLYGPQVCGFLLHFLSEGIL